jgi:hypothetical protein
MLKLSPSIVVGKFGVGLHSALHDDGVNSVVFYVIGCWE